MTDDEHTDAASWFGVEDTGELLSRYGHWFALSFLLLFMFITRAAGYKKYIKGDTIVFSGNDAWYHYRQVQYTVKHWPSTMPMDPWTGYPHGQFVGQFGTLYDQLIATAALIVGLGSPSEHTVRLVMLFAPPVFGTLTALPTYVLAKRLAGGRKWTGVGAVALLALLPGTFYARSLVGAADHNVAEPVFMTASAVTMVIALTIANKEMPVYEVLQEAVDTRDISALRGSLKWAALAGVAAGLYMWTWPPGVMFVGIAGTFFVVKAMVAHGAGDTPEPPLFVGAVSMFVTGVMALLQLDVWTFSATKLSLLQVLLAWGVALACVFLAWLSRTLETHEYSKTGYPAIVAVGGVVGASLLQVVVPSAMNLILNSAVRFLGLGLHTAGKTMTIREAQPFLKAGGANAVFGEYGALFGAAIVGFAVLLYRGLWHRDDSALFASVWALFITLAAFTQIRFNYYLAVVVAVFAAYALRVTIEHVNIHRDFPSLQGYQWISLLILIGMVVPMLMFPVSGTVVGQAGKYNGAVSYNQWDGSLDWLSENTPKEGDLANANNSDQLKYYGTYERTDNFEYPNGSYGVMSWWDYGHWITVGGERIPVANPFQQNAQEAAQYLLATNESQAQQVVQNMDTEQTVRYVMVDWQMVHPQSKFAAPATFHPNVNPSSFVKPVYAKYKGQYMFGTYLRTQRYYESLMVRLYQYHGSAVTPAPITVDYEVERTQNGQTVPVLAGGQGQKAASWHQSVAAAQKAAMNDSTKALGGIGQFPRERVEALNHYRLVHTSNSTALRAPTVRRSAKRAAYFTGVRERQLYAQDPAWVKTFERVPGATIKGTGPENTTVRAQVQMQLPHKNKTFTYTQFAKTGPNGTFTMTVPYSTTGYDKWGPKEGYTDTNVRATGPYKFAAISMEEKNGTKMLTRWKATAHVTEGQVIGETDTSVTVALESTTQLGGNDTNSSDDNTNNSDSNK